MSAPADGDLRECERLLTVAAEEGVAVSEAWLQDELGVGRTDLMRMLDTLREHGKAVEVAPGEWGQGDGPAAAEEAAVAPVVVQTADVDEPEAGVALDDPRPTSFEGAQEYIAEHLRSAPPASHVRLSRGMVAALEPDALGKLIRAGIDDVGDGLVFRFEVTP